MATPDPGTWTAYLRSAAGVVSAVLGIGGTCLMTRRYARGFWLALLFALVWPLLCLLGRGRQPQRFFEALGKINADVPPSARDMALGLNLLFWAFFLQLVLSLTS